MQKFEVMFLEDALEFLDGIDVNGLIKKIDKVPGKELGKARELMNQYFKQS